MENQVWVLNVFHNDYDQHGPTVEAIFLSKPTVHAAVDALRNAGYPVLPDFRERLEQEDVTFEELVNHLESHAYEMRHNNDDVSFDPFNLTASA